MTTFPLRDLCFPSDLRVADFQGRPDGLWASQVFFTIVHWAHKGLTDDLIWGYSLPALPLILFFSSSLLSPKSPPSPPAQSSSWPVSALSCPWLAPECPPMGHGVLTLLYLCVSRLELLSSPVTSEVATLWGWPGREQLQALPPGALNGM